MRIHSRVVWSPININDAHADALLFLYLAILLAWLGESESGPHADTSAQHPHPEHHSDTQISTHSLSCVNPPAAGLRFNCSHFLSCGERHGVTT